MKSLNALIDSSSGGVNIFRKAAVPSSNTNVGIYGSINELTRNMIRLPLILLLLFSGVISASGNLGRDDYDGEWKSNYAAVKNESHLFG